jgi:nucleoid-associated protein YgaU
MAAVVLAPHPEPRRPALRLVVSTPPGAARTRPARTTRTTRTAEAGQAVRPHRHDAAVYRRRRVAVALVLATVVVLGFLAARAVTGSAGDLAVVTAGSLDAPVASVAPAAAPSAPAASPQVYVVRPGDTVWSIAERLQPEGDVRGLVDQLTERIGGSGLQAGQRIALDGLAV